MKLKIPPNSLFAILLRSPWWASGSIAGAMALVCGALLPFHLAPYAAVGMLPLLVVVGLAAWRQFRAPSRAKIDAALSAAAAMPWAEFANALAAAWQAEGQSVQRLHQSQADLRLEKAGQVAIVSARRWKAATHGVESLRELRAAVSAHEAQSGVYIAMRGSVSDNARSFARDHGMVIMEGDMLAALLLKTAR